MERTNARNIAPEWFEAEADFASIDVSFISLELILPGMYRCLREGAQAVTLVKPQFEAGRELVGKNGVVRSPDTHRQVIKKIANFAAELGFCIEHVDYSPITGPKGNIEFLLVLRKSGGENGKDIEGLIDNTVSAAHAELI